MAGYSVSTEPSSRTSVGTFDFGLTEVNSGLNCPPSRRLTSCASYGLPISSSSTWMPIEQAPGEYISFITLSSSVANLAPRADAWTLETEVLAQCGASVVIVKHPAALQFGDNVADELLVAAGYVRGGDHVTVAGAAGKPFLQAVGDILRAADEARMVAERAAMADLHEITRRRIALAEHAIHPVAQPLGAGPG